MNNREKKKVERKILSLQRPAKEWFEFFIARTVLYAFFVIMDCASLFVAVDLAVPPQIPLLSWILAIGVSIMLCILPALLAKVSRIYMKGNEKNILLIVVILGCEIGLLALQMWLRIKSGLSENAGFTNNLTTDMQGADITGDVFLGFVPVFIAVVVFALTFHASSSEFEEERERNKGLKRELLKAEIDSELAYTGERGEYEKRVREFEDGQYVAAIQSLESSKTGLEASALISLAKRCKYDDGNKIHIGLETAYVDGNNVIPDMDINTLKKDEVE